MPHVMGARARTLRTRRPGTYGWRTPFDRAHGLPFVIGNHRGGDACVCVPGPRGSSPSQKLRCVAHTTLKNTQTHAIAHTHTRTQWRHIAMPFRLRPISARFWSVVATMYIESSACTFSLQIPRVGTYIMRAYAANKSPAYVIL